MARGMFWNERECLPPEDEAPLGERSEAVKSGSTTSRYINPSASDVLQYSIITTSSRNSLQPSLSVSYLDLNLPTLSFITLYHLRAMSFILRTSALAVILAATISAFPQPSNETESELVARQGYAAGICCFHLDEVQDCGDDSSNLYGIINLIDNSKTTIYATSKSAGKGYGDPINDGNHFSVQGPLPNPLYIIGEHENDYIQFAYGSLSWTDNTPNAGAQCTNGGWDPKDGPNCGSLLGSDKPAVKQMDCCFPC